MPADSQVLPKLRSIETLAQRYGEPVALVVLQQVRVQDADHAHHAHRHQHHDVAAPRPGHQQHAEGDGDEHERRAEIGLEHDQRHREADQHEGERHPPGPQRDLPARQARCVALAYLEGGQPSDVARIIGCTVSTARHHLSQGQLALGGRRRAYQGRAIDEAAMLAQVDARGRRAAAALREAIAGVADAAAPALVGAAAFGGAS